MVSFVPLARRFGPPLAVAPDKSGAVALELAQSSGGPEAAMRQLEQQTRMDLARGAERLTVNGLPAVHATAVARTRNGPVALDLTWIAFAGRVYRVTGMTRPESIDTLRPSFQQTAAGFGAITAAERAGIKETRIKLARARGGETLSALLASAGSVWKPDYAAVANELETDSVLRQGRVVKAAVPTQAYAE